ncbi:diguanylate cyclase [Halomonas sp. MCCC 1A11036]|uniref:diguanylate cyclase n=1 Tax=Billgrantia zhangzhouensis TaxID=2733481 RepID=A0ABS9AGP5_9GAMM|nr:sensor domain-containing diguanylate cyclase [Halomonas zhangzhouensis]MCE8020928.1 diguanylate cyclase [Halomonas zhangzhouensis]
MPDSLDEELDDASVCPTVPHTDATVQPHGCLLAFDNDWQSVCLASSNLSRFFGLSPAEALGRPPEQVLGADTVTALARALARGAPGITISSGNGTLQPLYLSLHATGRHVILEVEPQEEETGHDLPGLGYTWGTRIARASSTSELYAQLLQALHVLTGFASCTLLGQDHDGHDLRLEQKGIPIESVPCTVDRSARVPLMLVDGQAKPAELFGSPGPLPDLSGCPLCLPPPKLRNWLSGRQARAALILDLHEATPGRSLVVCRDRQPRHLSPPLRHLLLQLTQVATLRRALLHEKQQTQDRYRLLHERNTRLQRLAYTDPLTQVANRHRIEQVLETELAAACRNGSPLAVLLFDIDRFKAINDSHGHEVGDQVLHQVAQEAQSHLRNSDHLGRWGGEEFIAVVPGCDLTQAQELAWRVCHALAQSPIAPVGQVTASFGVAACQPGDSSRRLVQRADQAMYQAKRAGRACVRTQEAC